MRPASAESAFWLAMRKISATFHPVIPLRTHRTGLLLAALLGLADGPAVRAADGLDALVADSPFGTRTTTATPTADAGLEFRGMVTTGDGVLVGLWERETNTSLWLPAPRTGQPGTVSAGDITIRKLDEPAGMLVVDYHGRTLTLALAEAKILPTPVDKPAADASAPGSDDDNAGPPPLAPNVQRRQSLRQVEVINAALREVGADESLLLQGNPPAATPQSATPAQK